MIWRSKPWAAQRDWWQFAAVAGPPQDVAAIRRNQKDACGMEGASGEGRRGSEMLEFGVGPQQLVGGEHLAHPLGLPDHLEGEEILDTH